MRLVTEAHMEDLAVGAAVLGTGGGGVGYDIDYVPVEERARARSVVV